MKLPKRSCALWGALSITSRITAVLAKNTSYGEMPLAIQMVNHEMF